MKTGSIAAAVTRRFAQFYDAIKARYPKLEVISTMGYEHPTQVVKSRLPDLVNEHYYRSQEDIQAHALDYDKYSRRNKTKIFCGEWATRVGSPTPNMAGALGDCGMDDRHGAQFGHRVHVVLCAAFRKCQSARRTEQVDAMGNGSDWLRRAEKQRIAFVLCPEDVQHHARQ